ncbi:helix-turn-helix domain-containing protein [Algibacter sp. 2305UL17-15]|uniref:helix-turn-helix domain-containing protein n=1 Tax=Algibacter sp. 2305UL17-15 TaxID=3231268 RepID=UPI0034579868
MKRIYVMDGDRIQEYVPITGQEKQISKIGPEPSTDSKSGDSLLTISDLTKKFSVSKPAIYFWIKKGLLKRTPIGGRVLFDPSDIRTLIDNMKVSRIKNQS